MKISIEQIIDNAERFSMCEDPIHGLTPEIAEETIDYTVRRWERIYLEEGAEGLMKERRGRALAVSGTRKERPSKLDKKIEEDFSLFDDEYILDDFVIGMFLNGIMSVSPSHRLSKAKKAGSGKSARKDRKSGSRPALTAIALFQSYSKVTVDTAALFSGFLFFLAGIFQDKPK